MGNNNPSGKAQTKSVQEKISEWREKEAALRKVAIRLEGDRQGLLQKLDTLDDGQKDGETEASQKQVLAEELAAVTRQLAAAKAKLSEYELTLFRMESRLRQLQRRNLASEVLLSDAEFIQLRKDAFDADLALEGESGIDTATGLFLEDVEAQLQEYRNQKEVLRSQSESAAALEREKMARRATIRIDLLPADASLLVTGTNASVTGSAGLRTVTVDNPVGLYRLKAIQPGFEPFETELAVEPGRTTSLQIRLVKALVANQPASNTSQTDNELAEAKSPSNQTNFVSDLEDFIVEEDFRPFIRPDSLAVRTSGAKVVQLPDGRRALLSFASAVVQGDSAEARLETEKICKVKAIANLVAMKNEVEVVREEASTSESSAATSGNQSSIANASTFVEKITTRLRGKERTLPVVATWRSDEGKLFHLVIGELLTSDPAK